MDLDQQTQLHLCLQDRRGSTFLEIRSVHAAAAEPPAGEEMIRIGPTIWSAFLGNIEKLHQIIGGLYK